MSRNLPLTLAIAVSCTGAVLFWYYQSRQREKERSLKFGPLARARGWTFAVDDPAARRELGLPWGWGNKRVRNFVRGSVDGTDFIAYDDIYARDSEDIVRFYATFRLPDPTLRFQVIPRGNFSIFASQLGWAEPDFGDPAFKEAYRAESPDAARLQAALEPGVRAALLQSPGWSVEAKDGFLRITDGKQEPPPEEFEAFLAQAWGLARLILRR